MMGFFTHCTFLSAENQWRCFTWPDQAWPPRCLRPDRAWLQPAQRQDPAWLPQDRRPGWPWLWRCECEGYSLLYPDVWFGCVVWCRVVKICPVLWLFISKKPHDPRCRSNQSLKSEDSRSHQSTTGCSINQGVRSGTPVGWHLGHGINRHRLVKASALWANCFHESKCLQVYLFVCPSNFYLPPFNGLFAPTSPSPMSKLFQFPGSLGRSNEKK